MFDSYSASRPTPQAAALVDRICAGTRAENRAAAEQLVAIGELFAHRLSLCSETDDWAIDTEAAVSAEVGAALRISQSLAGSRLRYARALRERLPKVGEVFAAGDIDYRMFQTIVYRSDLITDPDVMATVDARLAANVARWPSMTTRRLAAQIDKIVAKADADALRRHTQSKDDREIWIGDCEGGTSQIHGSLFTPDAQVVDKRLDALACTVCEHDPRTRQQRRADALGAMAAGADRLGCRCGRPDCAAGGGPAPSGVVIHVIAEQATLAGSGEAMASLVDADGLISPELIAELAASARLVPLVHPGDAAPESGYIPSKALADFVRCRDLTCRWPGCDHPAMDCDVDHTIPHAQGGKTHAANLKCYCRTHHLVKVRLSRRRRPGPHRRGHRAGVAPAGSGWLRAAYPDPLPGVDPPCSTTRSCGAGRLERVKAMKRTLSIALGALAIWALMVVTFTQPSANAGPTCTPVGPGLPSQVCTCDIGSHWDAFPGVCEPDADNGSLEPPLLK